MKYILPESQMVPESSQVFGASNIVSLYNISFSADANT